MNGPLIAKQRIDEAQQSLEQVARKRLEEASENQKSYKEFYNKLGLLSGGTIALSITYLGFLKTNPNPPLHLGWLIGGWLMLFLCIVTSTFYSLFNTSYTHYGRGREYAQRSMEKHETLAQEVQHVRVMDSQSKAVMGRAELDNYIKELQDAASIVGKQVKWASRREKVYGFLFSACGKAASITFVAGIGFLLGFALGNIGVVQVTRERIPAAATSVSDVTSSKDKVVKIPCVGLVTFPASMSDVDVNAACKLMYDREQETRKKNGMQPCKIPNNN